ncbi:MAG TPA: flagellar filament capping protein FliD [Candidatus Paenibacillus intestinavium]|nr:flagellar filament capping protein FliD [Candidatus Paenibacillus intestinavium]
MAFSINGLSSGLDTAQIIKDMMAIENIPYKNMETKKADLQTQQGVFRTINSKFKSLETALNSLKLGSDYGQLKATSTGSNVSATAKAGASAGSYEIKVDALAKANIVRVSGTELLGKIDTNLTIGGYTLSSDDVTAINAGTNPEDKLQKLAEIINKASASGSNSSGANATLIQQTSGGPFELMLTSTKTGAGSLNEVSISGGITTTEVVAGSNAKFSLNGMQITDRSTNDIEGLISGVSFKLTGTGESTVTVGADTESIVHNMKIFVTAYNDLNDLVKDNLAKPADDKVTNPLQGNSLLKQIGDDLYNLFNRGVITTPGANGFSTFMSDLGLSIDKGAKSASEMTGRITFDEEAFKSAFAADPQKVINVLTNDADATAVGKVPSEGPVSNAGIFTQLSGIMTRYTSTVNGMLTSKITGYDSEIKVADERMEQMNRKLELQEARLKLQFSNMEIMLTSLKSEQSWLKSQFDTLAGSNK